MVSLAASGAERLRAPWKAESSASVKLPAVLAHANEGIVLVDKPDGALQTPA